MVPEQIIRLSDVQGLVLWVLGESLCPRWAFIKVGARLPGEPCSLAAARQQRHLHPHSSPRTNP